MRVADRGNGRDAVVASVVGQTAPEACRAAGYWAAAEVLRRSTRIPTWARWRPESATALAAFDDAGDVGAAQPTVVDLQRATSVAPHSGVLLHRLADAYDLDGRSVDAMSTYARAVAAHPRYPTALYRLAASLAMLSRDPKAWYDTGAVAQTRTAGQLARAGEELGLSTEYVDGLATLPCATAGPPAGCSGTSPWSSCGTSTRRRRRASSSGGACAAASATRSGPWARQVRGRRGRIRWIVRTSRLMLLADVAAEGRLPGPQPPRPSRAVRKEAANLPASLERAQKAARRPTSFWQVSYVLACYHATVAQRLAADDAEVSPGSGAGRRGSTPAAGGRRGTTGGGRRASEGGRGATGGRAPQDAGADVARDGARTSRLRPDGRRLARQGPRPAAPRRPPRFVWLAENIDDTRKVAPDV